MAQPCTKLNAKECPRRVYEVGKVLKAQFGDQTRMKHALRCLLFEMSYEDRNKLQDSVKNGTSSTIDTVTNELFTCHGETLLENYFAHCSSSVETTYE